MFFMGKMLLSCLDEVKIQPNTLAFQNRLFDSKIERVSHVLFVTIFFFRGDKDVKFYGRLLSVFLKPGG